MTVSAVSSSSTNPYQNSALADFRQNFMQMAKAINSGNLSDAQQAFATLSNQQGNGQAPAVDPNSPLGQALSQIGQELQNGDLSSAQQTLSALKSSTQAAHHGHHHHAKPASDSEASEGASTASDGTTGSNVNVLA
jgi:hypothetical protein